MTFWGAASTRRLERDSAGRAGRERGVGEYVFVHEVSLLGVKNGLWDRVSRVGERMLVRLDLLTR